MTRNTKQFLRFAEQLDREFEKKTDLFMKQRPFLTDKTIEPQILDRTDEEIMEKVDNDFAIEELVKNICNL